ncbi:MAG: hypothetical protein QNK04_16595 [Myxococcota bacterium]|nr:hypothetical protein [Myxococcota bacterium]
MPPDGPDASGQQRLRFCQRAAQMTAGLFDSRARNECLDAEGIAAEVIFSDGFVENHPPFSDAMETGGRLLVGSKGWAPELRLAGARAHNRWLAEFCAESRERRSGVVFLPPAHDPGAVVAEMRRAREAGLRGGVLVPPLADGLPGYATPSRVFRRPTCAASSARMPSIATSSTARSCGPLADRIGPHFEDVSRPPGSRPADYLGMGMR